MTKKWTEVNDLSGFQNSVKNNLRFKTPILRSDVCDYIDAYIAAKGRINLKKLILLTEEIKT